MGNVNPNSFMKKLLTLLTQRLKFVGLCGSEAMRERERRTNIIPSDSRGSKVGTFIHLTLCIHNKRVVKARKHPFRPIPFITSYWCGIV